MKINKALKFFLALMSLIILFFIFVYLFLFRPNFTRSPMHTEAENIKYFETEENHARHITDKEFFLSQNPEMLEITSFDGLKLRAYVLEPKNAHATILLMHGFHSDPIREFATLARFYYESGYNVVLPFQRAHGESEGQFLTFGIKERFDCRDWLIETSKIFGTKKPLYMEGISMGCATVLMTTSLEGLPENLCAVIADCGFTSPQEIMYFVAKNEMHLPFSNIIVGTGNLMTQFFAHFSLDEYSTIKALKQNHLPILFIHGTADDFVPFFMSWQNFEACKSEKEFYAVDGAKHAISNIIDYQNYTETVSAFLKKYSF